MRKVITARYAQKCGVCSQIISAGERAYWLGKGNGMQHISCGRQATQTDPVTKGMFDRRHTLSFSEARSSYLNYLNNRSDFSKSLSSGNRKTLDTIEDVWLGNSAWCGSTQAEMKDWLQHGFKVEGLEGIDALIPGKPRRKLKYGEEGDEMLIDLAWSGIDEHFIEWEKRNVKPGLAVEIYCSFNAGTKQEIIKAYYLWVARMLQTFDLLAIDVQVELVNTSESLHHEDGNAYSGGKKSETRIRVKEYGEAADIAAWSALFSPGAYRHFFFFMKLHSAQKNSLTCRDHMGIPFGSGWGLQHDEETNTLTVTNVAQSDGIPFPEFDMTNKLRGVIETIKG